MNELINTTINCWIFLSKGFIWSYIFLNDTSNQRLCVENFEWCITSVEAGKIILERGKMDVE